MSIEGGQVEQPESPAEQTTNIQLVRCETCGHISEPGSRFCSSCGASLVDHTEALGVTADNEPARSVAEEVLDGLTPQDAVLIVHKGPDEGAKFPLTGTKVTVGRSPDAMIFLDDVTVSRRHAELSAADGSWNISDNGSLNGTYVNRNRIDRSVLANGDEVQIGKYRFTFHQVVAE